ncbi:L-alanine exporter AlaE [Actibacterium sp. 188UL27-1]|uniref:L-alanine exporter AlaE n=1 Tax=Actibacterium sp. 188UL27-1 TaxID=2786961 RepID=UPI00195E4656|nr:L-alanine exporter AlaE [Actibacterium sp. 188UL27-1]MBM7066935.1 L-alanine exporter AlaE [Actibacterium sp. 188UL27-1]
MTGWASKVFWIDTLAAVFFFTIAATLSEAFIAKMSWSQVLWSRLFAVPAMIMTGRPYGMWRDWVFRRLSGPAPTWVWRGVLDILAFLSFQVPVYVAILLIAGATVPQVWAAVSAAIVFMVLLSRPFGLFLDMARRAFGVRYVL